VISSNIEHPAIMSALVQIESEGIDVTYVKVDQNGLIDPKDIRKAIRPETILVTVMYANNEIGTIQPIRSIAQEVRHARRHKNKESKISAAYPLFHTDACQAFNYLEMNFEILGADLVTFNSSKIYGPKGVGALYIKRSTPIDPMIVGGGQEFGFRSGTESLPSIVGFSTAVQIASKLRSKESLRLSKLRDYFIKNLLKKIPTAKINGSLEKRLPNNINFTVLGFQSELILIYLDAQRIYVSDKSACSSGGESSYVLEALGAPKGSTEGGIRISLGRTSKKEDLDRALESLQYILEINSQKTS
jgi:cysteine desulfurase